MAALDGRRGGRDGREAAEGQTGDAESQGRQLHKDRRSAGEGGRGRGRGRRAQGCHREISRVRVLGSSSMAKSGLLDEVMKTKRLRESCLT